MGWAGNARCNATMARAWDGAARATLALCACLAPVHALAASTVQASDQRYVKWTGRALFDASSPGSVTGDFAGLTATMNVVNFSYVLANIHDGCTNGNKLVVRIAGAGFASAQPVATLYTTPAVSTYALFAQGTQRASATLSLSKAVEARFTMCGATPQSRLVFTSFTTDGTFAPAPPPSPRRLELLGDSITSGDAVLCPSPLFNDAAIWTDDWTLTSGAVLCAMFGADCNTVSWGGMGMAGNDVVEWTWPHFPDIYNWTLGWEGYTRGPPPAVDTLPWDFDKFVPQGVVINLGTNDAWPGRFSNQTFLAAYEAAYLAFVLRVAAIYSPAPTFFLGFGPMRFEYEASVLRVLARLEATGVSAFPVNYTLGRPCGCGHPSAADSAQMAAIAAPIIAKALKWDLPHGVS
jgi:hypothetical protein